SFNFSVVAVVGLKFVRSDGGVGTFLFASEQIPSALVMSSLLVSGWSLLLLSPPPPPQPAAAAARAMERHANRMRVARRTGRHSSARRLRCIQPGRARRGASGSLNPQSALAGPNGVRGTFRSGPGPAHAALTVRFRALGAS